MSGGLWLRKEWNCVFLKESGARHGALPGAWTTEVLPSIEGRMNPKDSEWPKGKFILAGHLMGTTSQNLWGLSTEGQAVEKRWVTAQWQGQAALLLPCTAVAGVAPELGAGLCLGPERMQQPRGRTSCFRQLFAFIKLKKSVEGFNPEKKVLFGV